MGRNLPLDGNGQVGNVAKNEIDQFGVAIFTHVIDKALSRCIILRTNVSG
jgi:hypothetical protein